MKTTIIVWGNVNNSTCDNKQEDENLKATLLEHSNETKREQHSNKD
jgi:hypothetical protein